MIGVILWSDSADQKAVIWCEDQGDLAFLSSPDEVHLPDTFFEVGDVVQFDVSTRQNMRLARNPSRLGQSWGATLADNLNSRTKPADDDTNGNTAPPGSETEARIIPFRLDPATPPRHVPRPTRRRRC
jgi:hypothetical protein